ncbi:MAG TPA: hypothetical protein VFJ58_21005 [Armatimonadota bacterium]|nr:hypothetical protein [Armatimonadota bacterium]
MSSIILGYPGFIAAFILAVAIILPVLIRSLRQQNEIARHEHRELPQGISPPPPMTSVECTGCGQLNRIPMDAERALCGRCRSGLLIPATRSGA